MMYTNFAQTCVSILKKGSTKVKFGLFSLLFTMLFVGMGQSAHAQSVTTKNPVINVSILSPYSFKKDRAFVMTTLESIGHNVPTANNGEAFTALYQFFVKAIMKNLDQNPNQTVRDAVVTSYLELTNHSSRFQNPGSFVNQIVADVSSAIN